MSSREAGEFDAADHKAFRERLNESLKALGELLRRPAFGRIETCIGAELEMFLVDSSGAPMPLNKAVLSAAGDPRLTVEVNRYNLELNVTPVPARSRPFTAMREETSRVMAKVAAAGRPYGTRPLMVGMLPSLRPCDLSGSSLTDVARYAILNDAFAERRQGSFDVRIEGEEPCVLRTDTMAVQGACCSWQVHLTVPPDDFSRTYNAAQLAVGPVLAVAGNSFLLFGKKLWQETRIPYYEQGFGDRDTPVGGDHPRVLFGRAWYGHGATEIFAEAVQDYATMLPVLSDERPIEALAAGRTPQLAELRLHMGTVWPWNRAVYDPAGDGHLRIESRALPAGPTAIDMVANTAFLLGLIRHLTDAPADFTANLPFRAVRDNFYQAARYGLSARLAWPNSPAGPAVERGAPDLIRVLIPRAARGLLSMGVDADEAHQVLSVIEQRAATGMTGAMWQRRMLDSLRQRSDHDWPFTSWSHNTRA
ncbi:glutamate--cysteine ligase [Embleya sp. NPDC127516]|uniref:glutamate--cysteine ligase n=1 Tax=Embleya sp. NPDC127516 TaxID=3363990 RepID=UPI00380D281C